VAYADRVVLDFKAGLSPSLPDGTNLFSHLCKKLHCNKKRISGKFGGNNRIGNLVFRRHTPLLNRLTLEQKQQFRAELSELEREFVKTLTPYEVEQRFLNL